MPCASCLIMEADRLDDVQLHVASRMHATLLVGPASELPDLACAAQLDL